MGMKFSRKAFLGMRGELVAEGERFYFVFVEGGLAESLEGVGKFETGEMVVLKGVVGDGEEPFGEGEFGNFVIFERRRHGWCVREGG